MAEKKQQSKDPLLKVKYVAYCRAFVSATGESMTYEELLNYAKTYLCLKTSRLWKDPIWESYTDEELLVEYYTHLFTNDKDAKKLFEDSIDAYDKDTYDWLDKMVEKNQKEMDEQAENMEDKVSFNPSDVLGE